MQRNVLQIIHSFIQGGSERQMVQLTGLLKESGRYRVHIACLNGHGPLRQEVEELGFTNIAEFPLTSFYNRNAGRQLRRFLAYVQEHKIDLVHTHEFYSNIFGMVAGAAARIPARVASRRETVGLRSEAKRFAERRAYNLAHAVLANAEAVREQLIREGVRAEKIVTVYNGMDTGRVAPQPDLQREDALALFNLPREAEASNGHLRRRFVTIVANMHHSMKDQETFLRAARQVNHAVPAAAFVLAGEGERTPLLRAFAASLGLEGKTFFIGHCPNVAELLTISDVCALSSKSEGFSNAIIEYMAAARPVVATDVGGAREAIVEGETGYIVKAGDDQTMADRITGLLQEPERARRMGERGLEVVRQKFSCEAQLERVESLYEQLLARKSPASSVQAVRGESAAKFIKK